MGLCNFFRTHIKDFAIIAALLFRLTQKDSGYKSGPLPDQALQAFYALQKQLTSKPVMAFPKADQQYALITDAATGTADTLGTLGAILTQVNREGNFYAISFGSHQFKYHEKYYSPFLLEPRPLSVAWTSSMSTSRASNLSYTRITNHWRS